MKRHAAVSILAAVVALVGCGGSPVSPGPVAATTSATTTAVSTSTTTANTTTTTTVPTTTSTTTSIRTTTSVRTTSTTTTVFPLRAVIAVVGTPSHCHVHVACTLSGATSEGPIVSYAWTFDDGGTGEGAVVTHTYAEDYVPAGDGTQRYSTVTLTVRDSVGNNNTARASVLVEHYF